MAEQKEFRFDLNFQTSNENTFTLKDDKINANLSIKRVKSLIKFDQDYDDNANISLYYNDTSMANDKTLAFYGIKDNKHLIKIKFEVNMGKGDVKEDDIAGLELTDKQIQAVTKLNQKISSLKEQLVLYAKDMMTEPIEEVLIKQLNDKTEELIKRVEIKQKEIRAEISDYCASVKIQKQVKIKRELHKLQRIKQACADNKYANVMSTVETALNNIDCSVSRKANIILSKCVIAKIDECIYLDYNQTFKYSDKMKIRCRCSSKYEDVQISKVKQSYVFSIHKGSYSYYDTWSEALSQNELRGRIKKTFQPKVEIQNVC